MRLLLYTFLVLSLASCTPYQYITMDSTDVPLDRRKAFLWETDTVSVAYQFSGEGGSITITVYNKSSQPLYVNWKKSALINGGMMISLFNRNVTGNGVISTDYSDRQTGSSSRFILSFDLPEGIEFIPPQSGLSKNVVNLQAINLSIDAIPPDIEQQKAIAADGLVAKFRRVYYEDKYSPLRIKTYITLALGKNAENEFSVQHSFYVKEVMESATHPELFSLYRENGSQFYILQSSQ